MDRANNGQGRKPGVSDIDIEHRKTVVFELMLQGYRVPQIEGLIAANRRAKDSTDAAERAKYRPELDWDVQPRQLREYYRDAHAMLKDEFACDRRDEFRRYQLRIEDLLRRALNAGDITNARHLLKDKRSLLELNYFDHGGDDPATGAGAGAPTDTGAVIELPGGLSVTL